MERQSKTVIRSVLYFDSMNEKSQVTQERLYSENKKSVRNQEKYRCMAEKHRETKATEKKEQIVPNLSPDPQEGEGEAEDAITR
jgi:hypothetical protein